MIGASARIPSRPAAHDRPHKQAGHMTAPTSRQKDVAHLSRNGGRPHMTSPPLDLAIVALGASPPAWPLSLAARAVQGIGTALALACTPALATSLFPESARIRALTGFGMAMSLAAAIGPFLGGVLVELWGWPAVYWVRVPIAL